MPLQFLFLLACAATVGGALAACSRESPGSTKREPAQSPDDIAYYDVGEVERWFWDASSCEQAFASANTNIANDGRLTIRSGFYSGYSQLD